MVLIMRDRELDLFGLHEYVCREWHGVAPGMGDIVQSASQADWVKNPKGEGVVSCFLRIHHHFDTHADVRRVIVGKERLMMLGFPQSLRTCDRARKVRVPETGLCSLAGNTISVVVEAAVWACVFLHVDFSRPHGSLPDKAHHNQCNGSFYILYRNLAKY